MKAIEPGCLAMVVHSAPHPEHVGRIVRVIDKLFPERPRCDYWMVESNFDVPVYHEWQLLRIDDGDPDDHATTDERERETV